MFDFFRKHTRVMQFALVLLIFPSFVFFGVQGYTQFSGGGNTVVAKVAGQDITQAEWDAAHQNQVERIRRQMPNADAKLLDTPEMKTQSLNALVRERVMLAAADKLHLVTTDDRLQRLFANDPQFASLRNADGSVNKDALVSQGMSSEQFAQRLRQDLSMRQVVLGLTGTEFAPVSATTTALDAMFQQREVQVQRFDTKDMLPKVSPTDADIEAFYKDPKHAAEFEAPEQSSIEYVVLDLDALKKDITVSDDDLRKYYAENESRYSTPEERRASHILVKAEQGVSAAERAKAKAKAEALLAELKKPQAVFADIARKNSDDPGSAQKGGDLDFFARGAMVKPFEDAAFALKPGETSGLVESDFGYHIIKLTTVRGGGKRSFEAMRAEIEDEVKKQLAQKRFSEMAVEFTNMVYEQSDSLKPVVDKFKLELRTAKDVKRTAAPEATGPLANPKFLAALFGNDAITNKRNTEAVETGASQMVSGRVVNHTKAHQVPLAEVKARVRDKVVQAQAAALARKLGEERLAVLTKAPATVLTEAPLVVSRAKAGELPRALVEAVLKAASGTLPAYVGVDLAEQGYAVAKLTKVLGRDPVAADAARAQSSYAQTWGEAESQAYYEALKSRFKVDTARAAAITSAVAADSAASAAKSGLR
jgi:peptidyl-prolyl cis-trans isomerase D